jgi:hypothetical protein
MVANVFPETLSTHSLLINSFFARTITLGFTALVAVAISSPYLVRLAHKTSGRAKYNPALHALLRFFPLPKFR